MATFAVFVSHILNLIRFYRRRRKKLQYLLFFIFNCFKEPLDRVINQPVAFVKCRPIFTVTRVLQISSLFRSRPVTLPWSRPSLSCKNYPAWSRWADWGSYQPDSPAQSCEPACQNRELFRNLTAFYDRTPWKISQYRALHISGQNEIISIKSVYFKPWVSALFCYQSENCWTSAWSPPSPPASPSPCWAPCDWKYSPPAQHNRPFNF